MSLHHMDSCTILPLNLERHLEHQLTMKSFYAISSWIEPVEPSKIIGSWITLVEHHGWNRSYRDHIILKYYKMHKGVKKERKREKDWRKFFRMMSSFDLKKSPDRVLSISWNYKMTGITDEPPRWLPLRCHPHCRLMKLFYIWSYSIAACVFQREPRQSRTIVWILGCSCQQGLWSAKV